ncbi:nuclease EXOG, mitochondrial [Gracilinanus agilis]|uniref:nuclease EXOG, mitochondrial n=1 Tax=Gracilinanus agilis TaxID=191870 RepID=UPI001CFC6B39|nr:nuclease EXOG, mitochondrial [Gracilinanus agilis]
MPCGGTWLCGGTHRAGDVAVAGPQRAPRAPLCVQVIGEDDVAVPSHLYKAVLARRSADSPEPLALGAFVVPNAPIGFRPQLAEFQVSIRDLERMTGIEFFPRLDKEKEVRNLCEVDTCRLLDFREFTLYLGKRKIRGARTLRRLEAVMRELKEAGVQPDKDLLGLYRERLQELSPRDPPDAPDRRSG